MRPMKSLVLAALGVAFLVALPRAEAAPKKKYYFELTKVLVNDSVKADVAKEAQPRVEGVFKKALAENPQLVKSIDGAPDSNTNNGDPYRKFLAKKGISGSYLVTLEVTEASIEIVPVEDKKNTQRIVVSIAVHVLGETVPLHTMAFSGDGRATVKQEIGMKVRDKDRQYTWDGAAETAVAKALDECFAKLAKPPATQTKKK